jgi:hypothetical protein
MEYVFALFIISIIGFVFYRMIKRQSKPSNRYTPYDDITSGIKVDSKQDSPVQDTKHQIEYEERENNNKTV